MSVVINYHLKLNKIGLNLEFLVVKIIALKIYSIDKEELLKRNNKIKKGISSHTDQSLLELREREIMHGEK